MGDSGGKVRFIRCPKCENLLPELADYSVYQCGGCGAVLGAKKERQMSGSGCLRFLMVIANQCHKSMFFLSYQLNFIIKPTSAINLHKTTLLSPLFGKWRSSSRHYHKNKAKLKKITTYTLPREPPSRLLIIFPLIFALFIASKDIQ